MTKKFKRFMWHWLTHWHDTAPEWIYRPTHRLVDWLRYEVFYHDYSAEEEQTKP